MAGSNIRTTVSFRPSVASWLGHEKADRQHAKSMQGGGAEGEKVTRDGIVMDSIVLLSHVQSTTTMTDVFGRDAEKIKKKLLDYLSTHSEPSR